MKFTDYAKGTAFICLLKSDFSDERRFRDIVRFMGAKNAETIDAIDIPIDYVRAVKQMSVLNRRIG